MDLEGTTHTALVIKLGSTLPEICGAAGPKVRVVQVDDVDAALELIRTSPVHVVLLSEVTFRGPLGGFLTLLQEQTPQKHPPLMVVDLMDAGRELVVYESGASAGSAPARSAPLRELRTEILRLCASADPPSAPSPADLQRIGFNDCIKRDARAVHVQTEVLGGSPLKVRSTVMEGGGILDATTRSVDIAELQIDKVRDLVRSQHDSVVAEVRRGRYG
jgi:hypothetical protein